MAKVYKLKAKVWLYPGESAAWHFVNIDKKVAAEIKEKYGKKAKGFGSQPVVVTLGTTSWKTSIFPDKRSGTYLLPLKVDIRHKEGIDEGDTIEFSIKL
ncbi:MAG TPA: DUF1905 domain-containing protein [Candidatus Paceibacterota bacterium]